MFSPAASGTPVAPAQALASPARAGRRGSVLRARRGRTRRSCGATLKRVLQRPALVDIGGEHAVADEFAKRREIGEVNAASKPIFSFNARCPRRRRRFRRIERPRRIDTAGIDRDCGCLLPPSSRRQRSGLAAARGDPRPRDRCRRWPARTDRARRFAAQARRFAPSLSRTAPPGRATASPDQSRRQHLVDQPGPVLGADCRENWPRPRPNRRSRHYPRHGRKPPDD